MLTCLAQGKDATDEFDPIHPPDTLEKYLDTSKHLGPVDMTTVVKDKAEGSPDEAERLQRIQEMPLLEQCYNLMDFEAVARRVMKKTAWGYYSSAADDEIVSTASPSLYSELMAVLQDDAREPLGLPPHLVPAQDTR